MYERIDWENPVADVSENQGLVSWWLAGDDPLWGGPKFYDLCNRNHGTLTNGPLWQGALGRPGGFGSLRLTDSSTAYVEVPHSASLVATTKLSVSGWVRLAVLTGNRAFLFKGTSYPSTTDWYIWAYSGGVIEFSTLNGGGTQDAQTWTISGIAANEWFFLHCQMDGATKTINVNGIERATKAYTETLDNSADTLMIGKFASNYLGGDIDDIRIGTEPISPSALYQDSRQGYPHTLNRLRTSLVFDMGAAPPATNRRRRIICGAAA